jgi:micrococcal nuclease
MDRRSLLAIALAVLLALSGCVTTLQDPADDADGDADTTEWTVEVVSVVDGDTLKVRFPDGDVENVRLLGVDTPEINTEVSPGEFEGIPDTKRGRAWLRDWGHKADEWMRQRVADAEVTIATDPTADRRGSYGRLLVYVSIDGDDVNAELLDQGYARLYDSEFQQRDRYASLETTARTQNAGLWGYTDDADATSSDARTTTTGASPTTTATSATTEGASPTTTATSATTEGASRTTTATTTTVTDGGTVGDVDLAVVRVHENAEGHDGENLDDEYVVLENRGDRTIDPSGWTLRDDANHEYAFPDGFELAPGATVTIYTGSGTDTDASLYWGSNAPIWNNDGDVVYVETANGTVVVEYAY